jgi:hypothetical protein
MSEPYTFPAGTPGHIRNILGTSAYFLLQTVEKQYTLEQLREAQTFAQESPNFKNSLLWNKTKANNLARIIRKRSRLEQYQRDLKNQMRFGE